MKRYGYIYLHQSKETGRSYIGQSTQDEHRRFRKSEKNYNSYRTCPVMYTALVKYGWDGFTTKILVYADTQEELNELEELYIREYNSLAPNGYNTTAISDGRGVQAESTKEKIRQKQLEHNKKLKEQGIVKVAPNRKEHQMIDGVECKHCATCHEVKPLTQYNKFSHNWDGLLHYCQICQRNYRKKQYSKERKPLNNEELKQSYIDRKQAMSEGAKRAYAENPRLRENGKKNAKKIKRIDLITGEEKIYESGLAAKADGFDNTYVSSACKTGKLFKGYKWEFIIK